MAKIALRAAEKAGDIIMQAYEKLDTLLVEAKAKTDYVTEIDRKVEQIIIELLKKSYPNHSFLGEEYGLHEGHGEGKDYVWIIDPLDGTTNFIHGVPHFAVSIACTYKNELQHAIVLDPIRRESFVASKGAGASLNGKRIRVSKRNSLNGALIGTGLPFHPDQLSQVDYYMKMLTSLIGETSGIRRAGVASLDLAYVASGRYDAFWEFGLKEWDMAAGCLLIKEAGGLLSDFNGGNQYLKKRQLVCGNPKCFKEVLIKIQPFLSDQMKKA